MLTDEEKKRYRRIYRRKWYKIAANALKVKKQKSLWIEKNRERCNAQTSKWQKKNREKKRAHLAVWRAVKAGLLKRPFNCEKCGLICKPEAHHPDYSEKLKVLWLCVRCHRNLDCKRMA